ncbi:MAG TPA: 3-deoxy-manno-octulosonate cytidylyltransferase [Caulobacteraceae bacterium]|jgi:3-deoxy-manno-octulosonate cytidylyltransferase (CMP-KDO synthetase)
MHPIVLIPARMAASRLPGKPLADIGGLPLIVRVLRQAETAGIGPVAVAAGDAEIAAAVEAAGGRAVLTDPDLPSGSDRILAALAVLDPERRHDAVINLQGDIPFLDPALVRACAALLEQEPSCDIATLIAPEGSAVERADPDCPKAVVALAPGAASGRALYFTRSTLYGDGPVWRHIGLYGYRREALDRFAAAPPSPLERREKLEQLRALELGLSIWAAVAEAMPIEVNTPAELAIARAYAEKTR